MNKDDGLNTIRGDSRFESVVSHSQPSNLMSFQKKNCAR